MLKTALVLLAMSMSAACTAEGGGNNDDGESGLSPIDIMT